MPRVLFSHYWLPQFLLDLRPRRRGRSQRPLRRRRRGAKVYFINLKDDQEVTSPFLVQFGLSGMDVAPAGVEKTEYWASSSADR
jgi:hypothetical protein